MGDLLRQNIMKRGSVDAKWDMVSNLVQQGEMAPEVLNQSLIFLVSEMMLYLQYAS